MQNLQQHQPCRRRFEVTTYFNGDACGDQKTTLEQHLCVCDDCFETLIDVLNRHLDQAAPRPFAPVTRRQNGARAVGQNF